MFGRQSVKVTYAHKRRRILSRKKLLSSPIEPLPPETDDLTHIQMARRMLKRSRRVALAEQLDDPNVEQIREHIAKRIKHTQGVSDIRPSPQDDVTLQTPFSSSMQVHESAIAEPSVPEQFSPVPVTKCVMSRSSSRNLKENHPRPSQVLASPFSSRPGSTLCSPKRKDRGRSSHRASRDKSRTLSMAFKENARRALRKNSAVSLKETQQEHPTRRHKHQRCPSTPSISYMRSQLAQEDWISSPRAFARTLISYNGIPSPDGSARSDASFYADGPQSCSTPAMSRLRPKLRGHQAKSDSFASFSLRTGSTDFDDLDVEMLDATTSPQRQIVYLSRNSIFSSSGEFTIGSLLDVENRRMSVEGSDINDLEEVATCVTRQPLTHSEAIDKSPMGHTLAGSFLTEYDIPLPNMAGSPVSSVGTKALSPEGVPKISDGEQLFGLPGTSPWHGGIIHPRRDIGSLTPPTSPAKAAISCPPSSPSSDLTLGLELMNIRGDPGGGLNEETRHPSACTLQKRLDTLHDADTTKRGTKRRPARNRASTIRAADFDKFGISTSGVVPRSVTSSSNVRRTRSGTVVGPDSNLAAKGAALPGPAIVHAPVQSRSESEPEDELLLRSAWVEDLEYLGLAVPRNCKDVEADEMNLGGLWHGLMSGPPRRLGLRRR